MASAIKSDAEVSALHLDLSFVSDFEEEAEQSASGGVMGGGLSKETSQQTATTLESGKTVYITTVKRGRRRAKHGMSP